MHYVWVDRSAPGSWFVGVTVLWGGDYGWSVASKASKTMLGDIGCSSFRWLFFVNSVYIVSFYGIEVCSFVLAL